MTGLVDEIIFSLRRPVWPGADKVDAGFLTGLNQELIEEIHLRHNGLDFVEAVGSFAEDLKG